MIKSLKKTIQTLCRTLCGLLIFIAGIQGAAFAAEEAYSGFGTPFANVAPAGLQDSSPVLSSAPAETPPATNIVAEDEILKSLTEITPAAGDEKKSQENQQIPPESGAKDQTHPK
jgi:hypothetical protein